MSADRNLLFGILAVQLDFVSRDALIDGMNAWLLDKAKPLGDILRDRGAIDADTLAMLDALVRRHLAQHGNDPKRSLAALSSVEPALRQSLAAVTDDDVQHSLAQVTVPPRERTADDGSGTLLQPSPAMPAAASEAAATGLRYRILRPHARGGLGEVFVAEDTELGRHVALKEIQGRYADDGTSRTRFVLEAEITGGLEHPGIVPVYGLGSYADGRPFYAMRFIKGDNLLDAIQRFHAPDLSPTRQRGSEPSSLAGASGSTDFRSLEFRDLLRRFIDVCNAVAYAHSRGVLHRDLKPGNVMLGKYGETLVVDWGLAKALGRSDPSAGGDPTLLPRSGGESSVATVAGQTLGTPAYMSPEQADGRVSDLGPATDVYSLGATLYEVLAGRTAFHGLPTVMDVLCRVVAGEFPRPQAVQPTVPPALEAVCLKAMALRPADRYASATALARDLERWLADEPVSAYREPLGARVRRWVRRHARLVTGLAAALAVGAAALGGLAWQRERARAAVEHERVETAKERDAKEAARAAAVDAAAAERVANEQAQKRLTQVERANEILGSIFKDLNPMQAEKEGKPLQAVLGERLDQATAVIEGEAIGDPLTVARMQLTLGESQYGLGYPEKAIRLFAQAQATFAAKLDPDHPNTLTSMNNLAQAYMAAGQLDRALLLFKQTLELRKAKLGPDHPDTLISMNGLAQGYQAIGQLDRALPLFEETLKLRKARLGPDHPSTLTSMGNLASGYKAVGQLDRALLLSEETLTLTKAKLGPDHPSTLTWMNNLAGSYYAAGQLDRALPLLEETLRLKKAKLGPDHPDTLVSMSGLAESYRVAGQFDRAQLLSEETLTLTKAKLGPDHPDTLTRMNNLAGKYYAVRRFDRALPLYEETLKLMKAKLGPDHPVTLTTMHNLAQCYQAAGQLDRALPLLEETLRLKKAKLGPDHPDTLVSMSGLAESYRVAGQFDRALPLSEETFKLFKAKLGPVHPNTLITMNNLAEGYKSAGQLDRALPLHEEALKLRKAKFGPDHPDTLTSMNNLAAGYRDAGRLTAAEPLLRDVADMAKRKSGDTSPQYAAALANLGSNLLAQKKWADAEPLLRTALTIREKAQPDAWTTFDTQSLLGGSLLGQQKTADAEPLLLAGFAGLKQRADKIPKANKVRLAEAAERLVRLYDVLGKPDEAAKYLNEMWAWADAPAK